LKKNNFNVLNFGALIIDDMKIILFINN